MEQREPTRRGATPAVSGRPGPPGSPARGTVRPAPPGPSRTVIGVGPGARPPARLSPILVGGARPVGPGSPPGVTGGAPAAAPRAVPPPAPRPMHPPIARVRSPFGLPPAALQATAAAARPGPGSAAPRGGMAVPSGTAAVAPGSSGTARLGFGMPSLRRNVCPHFFMTGSRGAIPIQAPHLLKALVRQEANVSRCQLRGGVHLEQGYVNDVCLSARFNQCVFYEDDLSR